MTKPFLTLAAALCLAAASHAQQPLNVQLGLGRRAVLAQRAGMLFSAQERDVLLANLQDPDAGVRKAALKSLREYVGQSPYVWQSVMAVLNNVNEKDEVRYEAVKTLSRVTKYPEVAALLARYATNPKTPAAFRGIAYKALYGQAAGNPAVTALLLQGTSEKEPSKEGMLGAVWALAQASHYPGVAARLMLIAANHADMDVRVAAVRSLYRGAGRPEVFEALYATAVNGNAAPELRYPAILALSKVKTPAQQEALQLISLRDPNPKMRTAAVMAMDRDDPRIAAYFHMPAMTADGSSVDPLENE
ncbi:MAG: HEAT repeat domain-containing protein [Elusimicrobia bacterium]|nr:HEAT repeat domain-containing protein [Elusimicrobiota bacterium]